MGDPARPRLRWVRIANGLTRRGGVPSNGLRGEQLSSGRRFARFVGYVLMALILVALSATVAAQIVRDRTVALTLLMFVPIWLLALLAIVWDIDVGAPSVSLRDCSGTTRIRHS